MNKGITHFHPTHSGSQENVCSSTHTIFMYFVIKCDGPAFCLQKKSVVPFIDCLDSLSFLWREMKATAAGFIPMV